MITLMFLAIALMAFGSIMYWVSSNTMVTERNNLYVSAQAAAESATENVITTMMRDFTYGSLNPASSYNTLVPDTNGWPVQFTFSDTNGVANQTSVNIGGESWTRVAVPVFRPVWLRPELRHHLHRDHRRPTL